MSEWRVTDNGDGTYTVTESGTGGDPVAGLLGIAIFFAVLADISAFFGMIYLMGFEFIAKMISGEMGVAEGLIGMIPLAVSFVTLVLVNVIVISSVVSTGGALYDTEGEKIDFLSLLKSNKVVAMITYAIDKISDIFVYFVYIGAAAIIAMNIILPDSEWYFILLFTFIGISSYFYILKAVDYGIFINRHGIAKKRWVDIILSIVIAPFGLLAVMLISLLVQLPFYYAGLPYYANGGYFDIGSGDLATVVILVFMIGYFDLNKRIARRKLKSSGESFD